MRVIADIALEPIGTDPHRSKYIKACEEILQSAGLAPEVHSCGTVVDGDWREVFEAVEACHRKVHEMGAPRISTTMRIQSDASVQRSRREMVESVKPERGAAV